MAFTSLAPQVPTETRPAPAQPTAPATTASKDTGAAPPKKARASLLIARYPLLSFYALAFAISCIGILLIVGGPGNVPGSAAQVGLLFLPVMLAWLAGPSLASVLMTGLVSGRDGYRELWGHLSRWRVGWRWYGVALLAAPVMYTALTLAFWLASPTFAPAIVATSDKVGLLVMGLAYGLLGGGFLEELGWTGFAVPRFRLQHSVVGTGLRVGLLWGAYHFSVIYWSTTSHGPLWLLVLAAQLFAWLPAYRVLMVWVYERTGSLLVAMLMHASLTSGMLLLEPAVLEGISLLTWLVAFAAGWWLVVGAHALARRGELTGGILQWGG
jgi:uncharacterized protein